jgi:hypothetical protein
LYECAYFESNVSITRKASWGEYLHKAILYLLVDRISTNNALPVNCVPGWKVYRVYFVPSTSGLDIKMPFGREQAYCATKCLLAELLIILGSLEH